MKKQLTESFNNISKIEGINFIYCNQTNNNEENNTISITIVCKEENVLSIDYETLAINLDEIKKILNNKNIQLSYTITNEKELFKREKTLEERKEFYKELSNCSVVYSNSTKLRNLIFVRKKIKA